MVYRNLISRNKTILKTPKINNPKKYFLRLLDEVELRFSFYDTNTNHKYDIIFWTPTTFSFL